jgi:tetratricopeptide (TPR) repeat protein
MASQEHAGHWEEAVARLITEAEATADKSERVGRLARAAAIYENDLKDPQKAFAVWQAAFDEDFTRKETGVAIERLAELLHTGTELAEQYSAQAAAVTDKDQRAALLAWTGRWLAKFSGNRNEAEARLLEALHIDPNSAIAKRGLRELERDHQPTPPPTWRPHKAAGVMELPDAPRTPTTRDPADLQQRLDGLVAAGRWREAIDVLKALAAGEGGVMRAKYLGTAGKIAQNKLGQPAEAADLFNRALDAFPDDLDVFERLYQIFAEQRAWPQVEASLRRMIARVEAADIAQKYPALEALWRRLGDVYRMGLGDLENAARAYEVCARLAPHDSRYQQMLAELAQRGRRGSL